MEEIEVWLARDINRKLYAFSNKPKKKESGFWEGNLYFVLNSDEFPSVKWLDKKPTKAKLTLIK